MQILGLDAEIFQRPGGLHQGPAHQRTPGLIHGKGQLGGGGLGEKLTGAVHQDTRRRPLQQRLVLTQAGKHLDILKIQPRLVQPHGKQQFLPL